MKIGADILISIAKIIWKRGIDKYFTVGRATAHRSSDVARWRKYANKAKNSPGKGDDKIAEYLRIRLDISKT